MKTMSLRINIILLKIIFFILILNIHANAQSYQYILLKANNYLASELGAWTLSTSGTAWDGYMLSGGAYPTNAPAEKSIYVFESGTYKIWVHSRDGGASLPRVFTIKVNDVTVSANPPLGDVDSVNNQFVWQVSSEIQLSAGLNKISAIATSYSAFDSIMVTNDLNYVPPSSNTDDFKALRDLQAPTWGTNPLSLQGTTDNSISINWTSANDNKGIACYKVYANNMFMMTVPSNTSTYTIAGLFSGNYVIKVVAMDAVGYSLNSNEITANIQNSSNYSDAPIIIHGDQNSNIQVSNSKIGSNDVFVPLALLDKIDVCTYTYTTESNTVTIKYSGDEYVYTVGQFQVQKNGVPISLNYAPAYIGQTLMLPLSYLANEFDIDMDIGDNLDLNVPTIVTNPTLSWTGDLYYNNKPLEYTVEIATDIGFNNKILTDTISITNQYVPHDSMAPGKYWWRVKTENSGVIKMEGLKIIAPKKEYTIQLGATAAQIHSVLQQAVQNSPAKVTFEYGDYTVLPLFDYLSLKSNSEQYSGGAQVPHLFELIGAKNIFIDGQGSKITIQGDAQVSRFLASKNIVMRNFIFDTVYPLKPACEVLSVDSVNKTFTVRILDGYPTPAEQPTYYSNCLEGVGVFEMNNSVRRNARTRLSYTDDWEDLGNRTFKFKFDVSATAPKPTYNANANPPSMPVGSLAVFVPKQGGGYGSLGMFSEFCEDITLKDIRKYNNGGYSFMFWFTDKLKMINFLDKSDLLKGRTEGGEITSARVGAWLDGYELWNAMDDGLRINTEPMDIDSKPASNKLVIKPWKEIRGSYELPNMNFDIAQHWRTNDLRIGDEIFIYTRETNPTTKFTITDINVGQDDKITITLNQDIPSNLPFDLSPSSFMDGRTVIMNTSNVNLGAAYRNCRFENIGRDGTIGAASNFLIENCQFNNIGEDGIRVTDIAVADYKNIVVQNNTITKADLDSVSYCAIAIGTQGYENVGTWENSLTNVYVMNNEIKDANNTAIRLWSTEGAFLENNIIKNETYNDYGQYDWAIEKNEILILKDCKDVSFSSNHITDTREIPIQPYTLTNVENFTHPNNEFPQEYINKPRIYDNNTTGNGTDGYYEGITSGTGIFNTTTNTSYVLQGANCRYLGPNTSGWAKWITNTQIEGDYKVLIAQLKNTTSFTVTINHNGTTDNIIVPALTTNDASAWYDLGTFRFNGDPSENIIATGTSTSSKYFRVDAVQLVRASSNVLIFDLKITKFNLQEIITDGSFNISYKTRSNSGKLSIEKLICLFYNNNVLIDLNINSINIFPPGETYTVQKNIKVPSHPIDRIEIFIWDSFDTLLPLSNKIVIT